MATQMQQRIQGLIDKRPADTTDDDAIDLWVADISSVLTFHPKGKPLKKDIEAIRVDYPPAFAYGGGPVQVLGDDTRVERIVKILENTRDLS